MITGDYLLDAEFVDRNAFIFDFKENPPKYEVGKLVHCDVILHTLILYV